MKTSIFEKYAQLELTFEVRMQVRQLKNNILQVRYPDGLFTTDEHENALNEACLQLGIIL
jgi:beta-xylosidase